MRFRRKTKLFPGVYLNFSKSGISTTIGVPGANINFGKQGVYLNTGIPGTGLYNRQRIDNNPTQVPNGPYLNEEVETISTYNAETTTTEGLQQLKKTLLDCYEERTDLKKEIVKAKSKLIVTSIIMGVSYILILGFIIKWFKENTKNTRDYLEDLKHQLEKCFINIDIDVEAQIDKKYSDLIETYKTLITCEKVWDITSSIAINQRVMRSAAGAAVTRKIVKIKFGNIDIIKSKYVALHLENANGGDIYIYPAFIIIVDAYKKFGLIDIRELDFNFHGQRFIESERVPKDATVVGNTWAKVNKNGSPDKRFKGNFQIPICQYGDINLTSKSGLNEAYSFSSFEKSEKFANTFIEYQKMIK